MIDFYVKNGKGVDGAPLEVLVEDGKIVDVQPRFDQAVTAKKAIDLENKSFVSAGWVDDHVHVYEKMMLYYDTPDLDGAAEEDEDLKKYVAMGVDIVIYSGAKALSRASSALVLGKKPYFDRIRLQGKGIGRAMNIGKDNILGLTQAIEDYLEFGPEDGDSMKKRLEPFVNELNRVNNIEAKVEQDSAGRDIYRASVTVARDSPITAKNLIAQLKETSPAVYTREYPANIGVIEFDIRAVH